MFVGAATVTEAHLTGDPPALQPTLEAASQRIRQALAPTWRPWPSFSDGLRPEYPQTCNGGGHRGHSHHAGGHAPADGGVPTLSNQRSGLAGSLDSRYAFEQLAGQTLAERRQLGGA